MATQDETADAVSAPSLWVMLDQIRYIGTIGYGGPTALTYLRVIFVNPPTARLHEAM